MKRVISAGIVCLFILGMMQIAFAEQIILKSGDRISGKIVKKEQDKITVMTDFAGVISISTESIDKIIADEKDVSFIKINETNEVEAKEEATETKEETENIAETVAETESRSTKKQLSGLTAGWDGTANLGFSFTKGNSKTSTLTAGFRAERSSEQTKITTYLNGLLNRNRVGNATVTTSNAIWGGVRYDYNLTKKVFAFGSYDFERDKPQRLNFRSVLGGGLGYHAIKNDRTELDLFSGVAWNRTWFVNSPNTSAAEVLVGNSLKHKLNERVKIQQGFTFYPNVTNRGDFRFVFDSTLSADVTKRIGWFVTVADRFNSAPVAGVEKNDFLFATGLKWGFGKTK